VRNFEKEGGEYENEEIETCCSNATDLFTVCRKYHESLSHNRKGGN
jgi:hypothetical protein